MAKLNKEHIKYLQKREFYKLYIEILNNRLIYSNNKMESDEDNSIDKLYDYANVLSLKDNYDAFIILLKKLNINAHLDSDLIISVADTINKNALYISNGYRKIGDNVLLDDKYPIANPCDIEKDLETLLYNYYNTWNNLDIFEREALFNIEFLRIHPFEDGNGRTSRLILNYNMLRQGHAPIIIPEKMRNDYFYARDTEDVSYIKNMFEDRSKKELMAIEELIKAYKLDKKNSVVKK